MGLLEYAHIIALTSSALQHRKGANMLPYLTAPCHCPSLYCRWAHPHIIQTWEPSPLAGT